jgi:NADPH:quinone reductase-like Zn-dependent oxidoreductase
MSHLVLKTVGGDLDDTIALDLTAEPAPGADEVVVEVEAAPVNGADVLFAAGWFGVYPQVPAAMGGEGVGRVVGTGSQVDPALVGRRVIILPTFKYGTWATRVVIAARNVIPVSESGDPLQLAMLSVNPAAAYAMLHDFVTLKSGDWVGFTLGNSAIAHYLIALARREGIKTLAVVRRENDATEAHRLGATAVVVDGDDLATRSTDALDGAKLRILFEGTGDSRQVAQLVSALEDGGSVIAFASVTGQTPAIPLPDLIYRDISLRGFFILSWIRDTPRERLERIYGELSELLDAGAIGTVVEATYPLDQHQQALKHALKDTRSGKILFVPNRALAAAASRDHVSGAEVPEPLATRRS